MAPNSAYGATARDAAELFADYLEGDAQRPAFALSASPLAAEARNAIEKSLESFGYAPPTCTFATLTPVDRTAEGGDIPLDPQALFMLIESFDPLFVIATDAEAAGALAKTYRTALAPDAPARAFGRPAATFTDLAANLISDQGKQRAWKILKSLNAQR